MKLHLAVLLATLALAAANHNDHEEFEAFQKKFGKVYENAREKAHRFGIFSENLKEVRRHNLSGASWKKGVNQFSDLTAEEFRATLNYKPSAQNAAPVKKGKDINLDELPTNVDWREQGAVTNVKDQGSCGSCWAFGSIEQIESYLAINGGDLLELSPQQLTSCSPNELQCGGTGGCAGSIASLAFTYAQLFGSALEADYPYLSGTTGQTLECVSPPPLPAATLRGYEVLPRNDYAAVMDHVANVGPLTISVDAGPWGAYAGGVFDGCSYDESIIINHLVQLVGYGTTESGEDYWLARNSWGTGWGEEGFMKLKRETNPPCGEDPLPLFGTGCVDDNVPIQTVCGQCGILYDTSYPIGVEPAK